MAKGRVSFDQKYCKGCGLCVEVCPMKIISLDTETMMCPDVVITVERD